MNLIRLLKIISTSLRFGLDEILMRAYADRWYAKLWLALSVWRVYRDPRGVRLRRALEHLGPIFVKFGQVISTRRDILPADIAAELIKLQDQVKPEDFSKMRNEIVNAYESPIEEIFTEIEESPIGSASVAQVHKAKLVDGTTVAVKVLRPGIHAHIKRNIALLDSFAWLLEKILTDGKRMKPREIVAEFHTSLLEESDLLHEAANCNQIRRNFADHPLLRIPEVYWPHCTSTVMVMELLEGTPIDQIDKLKAKEIDLEKLAKTGIEVFFTQVFRDSFFHADMHPGNIQVDDEGRFVVFDFGIMGSLDDHDKEYIGANFLAFFNRDYHKVAVMHVEAGWTPADISIPQFESSLRAVCEPIFARPLQEISFGRLLLQLISVARNFSLIVQPQLILLQKTLLNIEGVGRQLAPDLNLWDTAKPFLENWAKEQNSPQRVVQILRDNAPAMISLLPHIPQAMRSKVNQIRSEHSDQKEVIRQLRRRNRAITIATILLALAVIAAYA